MKDYGRKIKISDLLRAPGKEDIIPFEKKFVPEMNTITEDGISGTIIVKALDRYSVLLTIENLKADVTDVSDVSGKSYIRHVSNPLYEALFIIPQEDKKERKHKDQVSIDESIEHFEINEKDESIDVAQCVENAITAVEPVVKFMDGEKMLDSGEDVESEYDQYV